MTATDKDARAGTKAVALEYDLPHGPEKVWRALTDPDLLATWLLPVMDARLEPGAAFTFAAPPQPGWDGKVHCRFIEIEPHRKLSYTWVVGDIDTIVTFTLTPTQTGTHLSLEQSGFKPHQGQAFGGARYGWTMMGERLVDLLGTHSATNIGEATMQKTNSKVDGYLRSIDQWQAELEQLRAILLTCPLTEQFKWRHPCYVFEKSNVVILGGFKEYCALSFFKGALLKDPHNLLVAPGENSQSSRLIKFTSVQEIVELEDILRAYIDEAIEVEKAGLKVESKPKSEYAVPEELQYKFEEDPAFKIAFEALTPGRQKGYLLHFAGAKQSKSRAARIEKYTQRIFDGKGMRDCVCGLSKKYPSCDGSHKQLETKSN